MGKRASGTILFMAGLLSITWGAGFFQSAGSGMVLHYRLEETAGPAVDLSGATPSHPGAWSATGVGSLPGPANTPTAMGAASTACLEFTGSPGQVSTPGTADTSITGDITIAFWMYAAPTASSDWNRIVGKGNGTQRTFGVWRYPDAANRIKFQQYNQAGASVIDLDTTNDVNGTFLDNTWTHIAVRVQSNAVAIFINGTQNITATRTAAPGSVTTDPVTLGYAGYHTYFKGRLDDVRIYNVALSTTDIQAIAAGTQGPAAPTGVSATAGDAQVSLSWTAVGGLKYNVKRSTVMGGPYTAVGENISGGAYVDTTALNGTQYYYVVSGVTYGEGPDSAEVTATPMLPIITARPNTGLATSENITSTTFDVKVNRAVPAGTVIDITLTSTKPLEGQLTIGGPLSNQVVVQVVGPQAVGYTQTVTVTGQDDSFVDGSVPYQVTVATASADATFNGLTVPPVNLTNDDNDAPGISFTKTAGLVTTEGGGSDVFAVTLLRQPFGSITMSLTSLVPAEVTVSPSSLTFTSTGNPVYDPATGVGNWNVSHVVTVTGVDDQALDFTIPFTIQTGALNLSDPVNDAPYAGLATPDPTGVNLDNEVVPTLKPVWNGGSGGGCGLLGPELLLVFGLAALRRRRRNS